MSEDHNPHPLRRQRMRSKGWRMPLDGVYCGRPTIFGNPFETAESFDRWVRHGEIALSDLLDRSLFPWTPESNRRLSERRDRLLLALPKLRGKLLLCWCRLDHFCHVDVIASVANS